MTATGQYQIAVNVTLTNGGYVFSWLRSISPGQTAQGAIGGVISIPTSVTAISLTGLSAPGYMFVMNQDATNFVDIGTYNSSVFVKFCQLGPGMLAMLPLEPSSTAYAAQANTAAVDLEYTIQSA